MPNLTSISKSQPPRRSVLWKVLFWANIVVALPVMAIVIGLVLAADAGLSGTEFVILLILPAYYTALVILATDLIAIPFFLFIARPNKPWRVTLIGFEIVLLGVPALIFYASSHVAHVSDATAAQQIAQCKIDTIYGPGVKGAGVELDEIGHAILGSRESIDAGQWDAMQQDVYQAPCNYMVGLVQSATSDNGTAQFGTEEGYSEDAITSSINNCSYTDIYYGDQALYKAKADESDDNVGYAVITGGFNDDETSLLYISPSDQSLTAAAEAAQATCQGQTQVWDNGKLTN